MRINTRAFSRYLSLLAIGAGLSGACTDLGATTFNWTGGGSDGKFSTAANWGGTLPSAGNGDTMQWNNSVSGSLSLQNTASTFNTSPGVNISLTASQTSPVTITNSANDSALRIGTNIIVAAGAGALTIGQGGARFSLALGSYTAGFNPVHYWTNNSANPVTFGTNIYFAGGAGWDHTLNLNGSGNWIFKSSLQFQNAANLSLTVNGSGSVTLCGTNVPGVTYSGNTTGGVTLNSGTLIFGGTNALYGTSTLTINGGSLDSAAANLVNANVNPQNWNGDFTFVGSQNLNLGAGAVTMNTNRTVTVTANTLTVGGAIGDGGGGYSLTKAGAGTLTLSGTNTFSGDAKVVGGGILKVSSISNALGHVLGIVLGGSSANGTLLYTGAGETSDRTISYTAFNGSDFQPNQVIDQSGSGLLKFTANLNQGGGRAHYLTLQGSTGGAGEIAGNISSGGGATTVVKNGTGTWTLSGNNSYTGGTLVNAGTLVVSNAVALGAAANLLTLASNATSVVLQVAANLTSPQATTLSGGADGASGTGSVIVDTLTNKTAQLQMNPSAGPAFPGLIVRDQGLLVLSGTNTFNYLFAGNASLGGNLLVTNGNFVVLQNSGNSKFDQGANVTIGSNAVFGVGSGNASAWFPLGDTAGTTNNMTLAGGSFIVTNVNGFQIARGGNAALTLNSGSVLVNDSGTLGLSLSEGGGYSTINLNGGRLTPLRFRFGGGVAAINFNGGTLAANASRTDFFPSSIGNLTANVRNSGVVVDSAGFNITISHPLVHSTIAGDNATDGGLTKNSAGALTLTGTSTYTGNTIINAGTLALGAAGSVSNSASLSLAAGATFDVSAISTLNLSRNTVLKASGTGAAPGSTAAAINGGGTVNFSTNAIILNVTPSSFTGDTTHPALLVTNASLTLNNNAITITNAGATPLGAGVYRLVQVGNGSSGSISGAPNATPVAVSGSGLAAGTTAPSISVSSGNINLTVQNVTTNTLAVTSGSNPSAYGNSVTFSATISPAPANGESVTFKDGATSLGTGTISAGVANFSIATLACGSHSITAVYAGDTTNTASTSVTLAFNVNQAVVTVASGLTANNKTYNGNATVTISSNNVSLSGVAAGDSGNVRLSTNGYTATFSTASVGAGKAVTVSGLTLAGSAVGNYTLTQPTLAADITAATLTVTANDTNRVYGAANPSFTASYAGFVSGENQSVLSGAPAFSTTANATSTVAGSPYTITVTNGTLSASNYTFAFVVGQLTITAAGSSNVVSSSANPSPTGSNVTFTATLAAVAPGAGTPTGTVQFLADGSPLGPPVTLANGVASLTTNSLSHGTHSIAANYAGDGNFTGSTNTLGSSQVINTRPIAAADALERGLNCGVKVRAATLLANDTDADSDPLTISSISSTSAEGGTVTTSAPWVVYTPPAGFTNSDSFSCVITDGGLLATNTISIAIQQSQLQSVNCAAVENLGNGSYRIRFSGIPGRTYTIQYSESLVTPSWQILGMRTASSIGQFEFTDTPGEGAPARFYRSTQP